METSAFSESSRTKRVFFSGVLALSIANILVKIIGVFFKIPIANILSEESLGSGVGLGYFSASYTVYVWLFTLATAGLPNGISIVVAEDRALGNRKGIAITYRRTLAVFAIVGVFLTALLFFGADLISTWIRNPDARFSMMVIAPTLFFICLLSVVRGYFYGFQEMLPSAISEVIESLIKLIFGIGGAYYAYRAGYGAPVVAAFAISGVTIGVALGTLYLFLTKRRYEKKERFHYPIEVTTGVQQGSVLRRVFAISIPITLAASAMSLTGLIDVSTMMARLQSIGYSEAEASALYGTYTMLAVPMYNLPVVILTPISSAVIPLFSSMAASGNLDGTRQLTGSAMRIVSLFVLPAALGLSAFSYPILSLLYAESSARVAAPLLSVLSAATFFLGLITVSNAVLQAHHMAGKTVISMTVGAAVKLIVSLLLVGNPSVGIYGVPIGTVLCYFTIFLINTFFLAKRLSVYPDVTHSIIRPLCAAAPAVLVVRVFLYPLLSRWLYAPIATLSSVAITAILYAGGLFLFRAVRKEDILLLPKGEALYTALKKKHLVNEE